MQESPKFITAQTAHLELEADGFKGMKNKGKKNKEGDQTSTRTMNREQQQHYTVQIFLSGLVLGMMNNVTTLLCNIYVV